jgi:hypothetical protein
MVMKLPIQARPVVRKVSTAKIIGGGMVPQEWTDDGIPIGAIDTELCKMTKKACFRKCYSTAFNCVVDDGGDCGFSECLTNCQRIKCP